jgi:hypothetical protein
LDGLVPC